MATSKNQYHDSVLQQVLKACGLAADHEWKGHDTLRLLIDAKPDSIELLAGVADFWLDLDKKTGPARRSAFDPPSPFRQCGQRLVASKGQVAEWDLAWRKKQAFQILAQSKSPRGRAVAEKVLRDPLPMLLWCGPTGPLVVGPAVLLPRSVEQLAVEELDVAWLRPDQALRRRWLDLQAAHDFLVFLRAAQRLHADELEQRQRVLNTASATATRDPGHGRL
jgi:hypothetical protein